MENWSRIDEDFVETPGKVIQFLKEIAYLYSKYNMSISHEDIHGSFIIENNDDDNLEWLTKAQLNIK